MTTEANAPDERTKRLKKTVFATGLGGVAGFVVAFAFMQVVDAGSLGELGTSREIAALVSLVYLLTAGAVGFGVMAPNKGAAFLNVEDAEELEEQKSMLGLASVAFGACGLALFLLALSAPVGPVPVEVAGIGFALCMALATWLSFKSYRQQDELMKSIGQEAAATGYYLVLLFGGGWAVLTHLGLAPAASALDWLSLFWAMMLLASFIVTARKGMMTMR